MQKYIIGPLSYTKINSKWINDLNVRAETIKFLEENRVELILILSDLGCDPKSIGQQSKINKWEYLKPKSFYTAKEIINSEKKTYGMGKKLFANHRSDKRLISEICKEFL